ncbi:MAG TPA: OadG family protein [Caldisericia bacterium]|mgnify:CR=1 FL=1|nr:OadG family protein [Caldisericia bacterium]HPF48295.1 OadG family protein [Caldisericia bacterium]HPI83526.1 OadG family protein [Caldisericia bacterium]HPQ92748.1 OadG family protein [Caldisericia bacterium]HRV74154.1 OadG family protein [Caldisericia bacterium]
MKKKNKTLQLISNITTAVILLGGTALATYFVISKWSVFMPSDPNAQKPLIVGLVAFVVTFVVLILVTCCIYLLKSITDKPAKPQITVAPQDKVDEDIELVAVMATAIAAFNDDIAKVKRPKLEFRVREMNPCGSSWRIVAKDDFESVGG